eukprot:1003410_1
MAMATSFILITTFISNTFAEQYTCDKDYICDSRTLSCSSSPCLITCEDDACTSMTVNANSIESFTFTSRDSTAVTINAKYAFQTNIHCIGTKACEDFTVYAGGNVVIDAFGPSAIDDGEWYIDDASAISITCASDSDDAGACLPTWHVPSHCYDSCNETALNIYCYGFGCRHFKSEVFTMSITSWNVHINGCTQCEIDDDSTDCVSQFSFDCLWSTTYNSKHGTSSSGYKHTDHWYGCCGGCSGTSFDCGCYPNFHMSFTNEWVDQCAGSRATSNSKGIAAIWSGSSSIIIAVAVGAVCILCLILVVCKRKKSQQPMTISGPVRFAPPPAGAKQVGAKQVGAKHVQILQVEVPLQAIQPSSSYNEKDAGSEYRLIGDVLKECGVVNWENILQTCVDNDMTDDVLKTIPKDDANWDKLIPSIGAKVKFQNAWFRKLDAPPSYNNEGAAATYQ